MLTFNGRKFARNDAEFTGSLFQADGTCSGFYKRVRNGIKLYDMQRALRAFIVDNVHGERFIVTAYTFEDGRDRYMHSTCVNDEKWLGIEGWTMSAERAAIDMALSALSS